MSGGNIWILEIGLGLIFAWSGLETRSGTGILWKREPSVPAPGSFRAGLAMMSIVLGVIMIVGGIVYRLSPR